MRRREVLQWGDGTYWVRPSALQERWLRRGHASIVRVVTDLGRHCSCDIDSGLILAGQAPLGCKRHPLSTQQVPEEGE